MRYKSFDRPDHAYQRYTSSVYIDVCQQLGRNKYRAIVAIAWLSNSWDGWVTRKKKFKKKGRIPVQASLISRRMMSAQYGYCEKTIQNALSDLLTVGTIRVASEFVYSSKQQSRCRTYYCPWMKQKDRKSKVKIYHGLLTAPSFLRLGITSQAILLLLHIWHKKSGNTVTINHGELINLGVSKRIITRQLNLLRNAGFIEYISGNAYQFSWLDDCGNFEDVPK